MFMQGEASSSAASWCRWTPVDDDVELGCDPLAGLGELPCTEVVGLGHAGVCEVSEPLRQNARRHRVAAASQLTEALSAGPQLPDNARQPPTPEQVEYELALVGDVTCPPRFGRVTHTSIIPPVPRRVAARGPKHVARCLTQRNNSRRRSVIARRGPTAWHRWP